MILLYFADDLHASRVEAALVNTEAELRIARSWSDVQAQAGAPECTVLAARHGGSAPHLGRLLQRWPTAPVVVVGDARPEGPPPPAVPTAARVSWCAAAEREIASAVASARLHAYLWGVGERIRHAGHLPPRLRQALWHVCRRGSPNSVRDVARHLRCTPRILSHHWRNAVPSSAGVRLEDFLAWILLLHAVALRTAGGKWATIAEGLDSHPHTLTRTALRLADTPLRELPLQGMGAAVARFEARVVRHLLEEPDFRNCK